MNRVFCVFAFLNFLLFRNFLIFIVFIIIPFMNVKSQPSNPGGSVPVPTETIPADSQPGSDTPAVAPSPSDPNLTGPTSDPGFDASPESTDVPLENVDESTDNLMDPMHVFQPYKYDPTNKRDPFLSLRIDESLISASMGEGLFLEPSLPLARFNLDQLQLKGIIWDTDEPRVLFLDPNNKRHVAKKNDRIGRNKGYLAEIRDGEVIIVEPEKQGSKIQYSIKTMVIQKTKQPAK